MAVFPSCVRFAALALLAGACNSRSGGPCAHCDGGGRDVLRDQPQATPPADVPWAYDATASLDAADEDGGARLPTTWDGPASEARLPTPIIDAGKLLVDELTGTSSNWRTVDVPGTPLGVWSVVTGTSGSLLTQGMLDGTTWHIAYVDTVLGPDQVIEAKLRALDFYAPTPSYAVALFGRYDPTTDSGYLVALRADGSVTLRRRDHGTNASWGKGTAQGVRAGVWYTVRLELVGATVTAFIDGTLVASVTDQNPLPQGRVGVGAFGATLELDRILVAEPATEL